MRKTIAGPKLTAIAMIVAIALIVSGDLLSACAADYPTRPIRMIVPFPPGGGNDLLARAINQRLGQLLGQQIVVDNRGGAGGMIGTEMAAKSAPDGYTIFLGSIGNLTFIPVLQPDCPYDPVRDFAPVALLATSDFILVVNPSVPAKSVKELIALAKARPGRLLFGSAGIGSSLHMTGELFKLATGIDIKHIPYKGTAPALTDLLGGEVQMLFSTMPSVLPHVKSGKLRALGVSGAKRSEAVPEVPTIAESIPGFEVLNWQGITAPQKTPEAIIQKLNGALLDTLKAPETIKALENLALDPAGGTPEQFGALIRTEIERYKKVVKEAKITIN
jgi:tripartite-type tricarboxylate transporter receptor subunit TctC